MEAQVLDLSRRYTMQPSFQIVASEAPLLDWLLAALKPMPRTRVKQLLKHGRITVNGQPIAQVDHPLQPGDRVAVTSDRIDSAHPLRYACGLPVVFGDDQLLVIDKPAGLLSVADSACTPSGWRSPTRALKSAFPVPQKNG